jgi:putative ABC transport system permease protein
MNRFLFNLQIAWEALMHNKVRSFLTALGIIFGVASVISMQAIGRGTQQAILDQIKLVGVNNIVIEHKVPDPKENNQEESSGNAKKEPASLGLSLADAESIGKQIPNIARISPETVYDVFAIRNGKGKSAKLIGVSPDYFSILTLPIETGRTFTADEVQSAMPICIIGSDVKKQFFGGEDPIGKSLKCGTLWLKVVGVLAGRQLNDETASKLKITNGKLNVYVPIHTVLIRYKNRGLITKSRVESGNNGFMFGDDNNSQPKDEPDYHQIDKLIVQVTDAKYMSSVSDVISRLLTRRHNGADDFTITIPELLLQQQQDTENTFNLVLGIIAAISLLVGGIGIMNIMLVSVVERMREIGIRQALGATQNDIIFQFLAEAILISISGGIIGILLGISISKLITQFSHILTIITAFSVILSFLVSATVGLIFGVAPARKAASQDPVESLRHE